MGPEKFVVAVGLVFFFRWASEEGGDIPTCLLGPACRLLMAVGEVCGAKVLVAEIPGTKKVRESGQRG